MRDRINSKLLSKLGWRERVVWECELKNKTVVELQMLTTDLVAWLKQ